MAEEADLKDCVVIAKEFKPFGIEVRLAVSGRLVHLAASSLQDRQASELGVHVEHVCTYVCSICIYGVCMYARPPGQ